MAVIDRLNVNQTPAFLKDGVFDISEYNNGAVYSDLSDALGRNGINIPSAFRKGGMSVKFIMNDNKYVQYNLITSYFSTIKTDWYSLNPDILSLTDLMYSDKKPNNWVDDQNVEHSPYGSFDLYYFDDIKEGRKILLFTVNYTSSAFCLYVDENDNIVGEPFSSHSINSVWIESTVPTGAKRLKVSQLRYNSSKYPDAKPLRVLTNTNIDDQKIILDEKPMLNSGHLLSSGVIKAELDYRDAIINNMISAIRSNEDIKETGVLTENMLISASTGADITSAVDGKWYRTYQVSPGDIFTAVAPNSLYNSNYAVIAFYNGDDYKGYALIGNEIRNVVTAFIIPQNVNKLKIANVDKLYSVGKALVEYIDVVNQQLNVINGILNDSVSKQKALDDYLQNVYEIGEIDGEEYDKNLANRKFNSSGWWGVTKLTDRNFSGTLTKITLAAINTVDVTIQFRISKKVITGGIVSLEAVSDRYSVTIPANQGYADVSELGIIFDKDYVVEFLVNSSVYDYIKFTTNDPDGSVPFYERERTTSGLGTHFSISIGFKIYVFNLSSSIVPRNLPYLMSNLTQIINGNEISEPESTLYNEPGSNSPFSQSYSWTSNITPTKNGRLNIITLSVPATSSGKIYVGQYSIQEEGQQYALIESSYALDVSEGQQIVDASSVEVVADKPLWFGQNVSAIHVSLTSGLTTHEPFYGPGNSVGTYLTNQILNKSLKYYLKITVDYSYNIAKDIAGYVQEQIDGVKDYVDSKTGALGKPVSPANALTILYEGSSLTSSHYQPKSSSWIERINDITDLVLINNGVSG